MKLFCTLRSPYARKVRVLAHEKKCVLELIEEDFTAKSDAFLKANPVGKVPTLITDDGEVFCDSPIICEYIDLIHDQPIFIPRSSPQRLFMLNQVAIADGLMDRTVAVFMEKLIHPDHASEVFISNQKKSIDDCLTYFEHHSFLGEKMSLLNIAVGCAIGYILFRLPELFSHQKYPQLSTWYHTFNQRPSMQQTLPVNS